MTRTITGIGLQTFGTEQWIGLWCCVNEIQRFNAMMKLDDIEDIRQVERLSSLFNKTSQDYPVDCSCVSAERMCRWLIDNIYNSWNLTLNEAQDVITVSFLSLSDATLFKLALV